MADENAPNLVELATDITIAWLSNANNRVVPDDVPVFLRTIHATVAELSGCAVPMAGEQDQGRGPAEHVPAVSARRSLASKDHILSMIDGKPYKTLRRHLSTHGLTPEEYRARYKLKPDYPMVAENYSAARRDMAKKIGLGAKGRVARSGAGGGKRRSAKPEST